MDCTACGQAVLEGAAVCGHCGAAVAKAAEPTPGFAAASGSAGGSGNQASGQGFASQVAANRLAERVKAILLRPRTEWPIIADEASTPQDIYLRYVAPLVAIGVIATFIGTVVVGMPVPLLGTMRLGIGTALAGAIVHFVLTFIAVFVIAMIVDALAPTFGGQKDALRALKVTAYSFTPGWIAAILTIVPMLGFLAALISLYGLYLMYLGLPVLMRVPNDKALGYTVVVVLCAIVLGIVVSALTGLVTGGYGMRM